MKKDLKVMVCVTRQKTCERLIKIGSKTARDNGGELFIVHVTKDGTNFLNNPREGEALEYLFQIARDTGAEMTVAHSSNIINTLAEFAKKNEITTIILGESPHSKSDSSVILQLEEQLPEVNFKIVPS
ncbi:universal stress protein UspA [Petroclostridium sp. X23]|uniref:universal stress protein UspA n=1 Tax=Petroclostridium sp. X23 TaxID=3045146 RepID=UPI0024AE3015|nr:universal stress protein UspA [Petroclostridium sp. X23]WHH60196.1 universal stress protein UspA [Petroclostridium sp. X23]